MRLRPPVLTMPAGPASPAKLFVLVCVLCPPAVAEETAAQDSETPDPCAGEVSPDARKLDSIRAGLHRGVCSTARFVDQLFGRDDEYFQYEDESNGRAGLALGWNEHDDLELDSRFRASVNLPQINERFNATIGRASSDEYIADEQGAFNPASGQFLDDEPAEWFAGIGYRALRRRDSRFDLGAGMQLETPLNPYANARYRRYFYVRPDVLLTLRTTAFVENKEGFGLTQAFDIDHVLTPEYLFRLGNSVRVSEATDGARWRVRAALYHAIDYRRAMRYEARIRGETDGTQPDQWGFGVTHRRSKWRDWLFLEFGAELFWADGPLPSDRCSACLGATVGFEILFGEAYDHMLRRDASRLPAGEPAEVHP